MVKQEDFAVEQFMDKYETKISFNLGETCCDSMTVEDLINMYPEQEREQKKKEVTDEVFNTKLTYGHIRGSEKLKLLIAEVYNEDGGDNAITTDNIVITNGAIGANFLSFYSMVDDDDSVIVVDPTYQQLSSVPQVFSGKKVITFPLKYEEKFQPDLPLLKRLIQTHKPKLLVINNPNNPTGAVWNNETLEAIVGMCRDYQVCVFCDEVYRPLYHSLGEQQTPPKSIINFGYDNSISTGSMSKAFSLAGLRLGWIVTRNSDILQNLFSKRDYNTISVSILDDLMARLALQNYKKLLTRNYDLCRNNIKTVEQFITSAKEVVTWIPPQAGTTGFLKFNGDINTNTMCIELVNQHNCLLVPGEVFGHPGYCRIGVGNSSHDLQHGLQKVLLWLTENHYLK